MIDVILDNCVCVSVELFKSYLELGAQQNMVQGRTL